MTQWFVLNLFPMEMPSLWTSFRCSSCTLSSLSTWDGVTVRISAHSSTTFWQRRVWYKWNTHAVTVPYFKKAHLYLWSTHFNVIVCFAISLQIMADWPEAWQSATTWNAVCILRPTEKRSVIQRRRVAIGLTFEKPTSKNCIRRSVPALLDERVARPHLHDTTFWCTKGTIHTHHSPTIATTRVHYDSIIQDMTFCTKRSLMFSHIWCFFVKVVLRYDASVVVFEKCLFNETKRYPSVSPSNGLLSKII